MEMYVGSVERIAYYAECDDEQRKETPATATAYGLNNNTIGGEQHAELASVLAHEGGSSSAPQDVVELKSSGSSITSAGKVCNNDKLFGLSEMSAATPTSLSYAASSSSAATTKAVSTTDRNVDKTVADSDVGADVAADADTKSPLLADVCSHNDDDTVAKLSEKQQMDDNLKVKTNVAVIAAADNDDDSHHRQHITNDGHIAVTTKTFQNKQQTTDDIQVNAATTTTPVLSLLSLSKNSSGVAKYKGSKCQPLEQCNDAERRASTRRQNKATTNNNHCK